jgi:hypothetical protein
VHSAIAARKLGSLFESIDVYLAADVVSISLEDLLAARSSTNASMEIAAICS